MHLKIVSIIDSAEINKHGGPWLTTGPSGADMSRLKDAFDRDPGVFNREPERRLSVDAWMEHISREWAGRVRSDKAVADRMATTPELGSALWVSYERLHEDVEGQRARMFTYLGVDPGLARAIPADSNAMPGYTHGNPLDYFRSGKVGDWKRFFSARQLDMFMANAGAELRVAEECASAAVGAVR